MAWCPDESVSASPGLSISTCDLRLAFAFTDLDGRYVQVWQCEKCGRITDNP